MLSREPSNVFETTNFACLVNASRSSNQEIVYALTLELSDLPPEEKLKPLQRQLTKESRNTYQTYLPGKPDTDHLRKGFNLGLPATSPRPSVNT